MKKILTGLLLLASCSAEDGEPRYSYETMFTIPFDRNSTLIVNDPTGWEVELYSLVTLDVVAPQHGFVKDVRTGAFTIRHWDSGATMVVDDLEDVWVHSGDRVCAGEVVGSSFKARVRAFWGEEVDGDLDISTIRAIRDGGAVPLSRVEPGDKIYSALSELNVDRPYMVDAAECPYQQGE